MCELKGGTDVQKPGPVAIMKLNWVIQMFESFISVCGPLVASDVITNQKKKVITQRPVMMMIIHHEG